MLNIIIAILCGINIVISSVVLVLQIRSNFNSNAKNSDTAGNVYCPNCCQPFPANLKNCPKCGQPKKINH